MLHTRRLLAPTIASLALLAATLGCGNEATPPAASAPAVNLHSKQAATAATDPGTPAPVADGSPAPVATDSLDGTLRREGQDVRQAAGAIKAQVGGAGRRVAGGVAEVQGQVDQAVTET